MNSEKTVLPQCLFCFDSLYVFFHELLVKVRSQSVVDETSFFLVDLAASAVLKHNVVIPSEHTQTHVLLLLQVFSILWPLYRTACVSRHPEFRTGGFYWSKVLQPACPC